MHACSTITRIHTCACESCPYSCASASAHTRCNLAGARSLQHTHASLCAYLCEAMRRLGSCSGGGGSGGGGGRCQHRAAVQCLIPPRRGRGPCVARRLQVSARARRRQRSRDGAQSYQPSRRSRRKGRHLCDEAPRGGQERCEHLPRTHHSSLWMPLRANWRVIFFVFIIRGLLSPSYRIASHCCSWPKHSGTALDHFETKDFAPNGTLTSQLLLMGLPLVNMRIIGSH